MTKSDDRAPAPIQGRLGELDGLRGWAALWVVVFHFGWETFGARFPGFRNPIAAAFNGDLAVTVFFVLSGEALSAGFFSGRGLTQVVGLAVKRLPRLSIPAFGATLLTFLVARLDLTSSLPKAAQIVARVDWLGMMNPGAISIVRLVKFPLIDMYMSSEPNFDAVPFLWTMNIEMIGSILVFVILMCWSRIYHLGKVVFVLAMILLLNQNSAFLSDFCFGVIIAQWRYRGLIAALGAKRAVRIAAPLLAVAVLVASATVMYAGLAHRVAPVLAPFFVLAVSMSPQARAFLSTRLSANLGRLSFPLYLVQYPVLVAFSTSAITWAYTRGQLTGGAALAIMLCSTFLAFFTAWLFLPVEKMTDHVGQELRRRLVSGTEREIARV